MILDNFPKVLWINLQRSSKRKEYMESLLNKYQIDNLRIQAIDGLVAEELDSVCFKNVSISNQENACSCSHLLAIKYFLEKMEDDKIIIFEDDVSFEFLRLIPFNWSEFECNLPSDYYIVQLAITKDFGSVNNILVSTNTKSKYYCSTAYLITRLGAQNIINKYFCPETGKINLRDQKNCTADAIISDSGKTFSIPIFTYLTTDSTIHPNHLPIHTKSKIQQQKLWIMTSRQKQFDKNKYFHQFAK
ncbi:glycosyltransferase family 25 [Moumouvirus australiensis]|uniref:Glycosyltransferase family 25 n=1 Tax=Moumouvirus australiensis TaxID=2109587 RepID=A0A2P1EMC1_9VIRU|nr:glycosyltransferase family 25 [Moumouvirus australiensis]AVL95030.1 glycosyltransferase family 25 [Moumouvirus australiensis]